VDVIERNNVNVRGLGERAMVFAHGFGCDQNMWRFVEPAFEVNLRRFCSTTSAPADLT
jgi:sigma-B regulation protein RsbQ